MRAAAVGLLELRSTGPLISMLWRWGVAWAVFPDALRAVNECLFLAFFFPSAVFPLPDGPSPPLSCSINCSAAELN